MLRDSKKPEARSPKFEAQAKKTIPKGNLSADAKSDINALWRRWRGGQGDFGGPSRVIISAVLIFLVSQILAIWLVGLISAILHPHVDLADYLGSSVAAQFFYILIAEAVVILMVWWLLCRRRVDWRLIGFKRWPHWRDIKWATAGFVAFFAISIIVGGLISWLFPHVSIDQNQDVGFNSLVGPMAWITAFVGLVILPPLGEETLVRGYLYTGLRSKLKFVPALLITSVLFGLAHLQYDANQLVWVVALDTFLLSLVLVYLREKTGLLYAGMLVHLLNNLIAFLVHFHV